MNVYDHLLFICLKNKKLRIFYFNLVSEKLIKTFLAERSTEAKENFFLYESLLMHVTKNCHSMYKVQQIMNEYSLWFTAARCIIKCCHGPKDYMHTVYKYGQAYCSTSFLVFPDLSTIQKVHPVLQLVLVFVQYYNHLVPLNLQLNGQHKIYLLIVPVQKSFTWDDTGCI